ncbi:MAG: hypothetical protein IIA48_10675 [Bacteroidetes bacterium]|nr:hypothetical protein [Bacteroidota bacterium]
MREISPAENMTAEEYLELLPNEFREIVNKIREEKKNGKRPVPSSNLIDKSNLLEQKNRSKLIDQVALLVDENLAGRSEMCIQFAILLSRALEYLKLPSKIKMGTAMYFDSGKEIFRWDHCWVRIGDEVIDGNVDILYENPMVPESVKVQPYWGSIKLTPPDRRLRENRNMSIPDDTDVENFWWPDLKKFIDNELSIAN